MQKDEKQQIAARLKDYCVQKGSQNKAANSMNGVSSATISKVLSGDWDTISDEMWRTIAPRQDTKRKNGALPKHRHTSVWSFYSTTPSRTALCWP